MFHRDSSYFRALLFNFTCFIIICFYIIPNTSSKKIRYFSLERPKISINTHEYFENLVIKSRLKSRSNPIHYVDVNVTLQKQLNNNQKFYIGFYQLLSNVYKPSFVEYKLRVCDILKNDILVAAAFTEAFNRIPQEARPMPELTCPILPGNYTFTNMVIPMKNIPEGFPFREGRLYVNLTRSDTIVLSVYIDFSLQTIDV